MGGQNAELMYKNRSELPCKRVNLHISRDERVAHAPILKFWENHSTDCLDTPTTHGTG